MNASMTEAEIKALLDAHDVLVKACVDTSLPFSAFVLAYSAFPHNYGLPGHSKTAQEQFVSRLFGRRVAFHLRVASLLSGLRSADDPVDVPYEDAGRFLPALKRTYRGHKPKDAHADFASDGARRVNYEDCASRGADQG